MNVTFEITRLAPRPPHRNNAVMRGTEVLAEFDVDVFPFKIWCGYIVQSLANGSIQATLPGRRQGGISISSPELRTAILDEAVAMWHDRQGTAPTIEGGREGSGSADGRTTDGSAA